MGDIGRFSIYPARNLEAYGDSGMAVTDNPQIADEGCLLGQIISFRELGAPEISSYTNRRAYYSTSVIMMGHCWQIWTWPTGQNYDGEVLAAID